MRFWDCVAEQVALIARMIYKLFSEAAYLLIYLL